MIAQFGEAWLGTEASFLEIKSLHDIFVKEYLPEGIKEGLLYDDGDDDDENEEDLSAGPVQVDLLGNVALITVSGGTIQHSCLFSQVFGIPTYDDIQEAFANVYNKHEENGTDCVILSLDTPGGSAAGVPALSEFIHDFNQNALPVVTHTAGTMYSAGMWYGSAAGAVVADKYSRLGSVGVIAVVTEVTELLKKEGITPHVFRSAPHKALGNPYEKLTDVGKKQIQGEIDETHGWFVEALSTNLSLPAEYIAKEIANGDTYSGQRALELGLASDILPLTDLIDRLMADNSNQQRGM